MRKPDFAYAKTKAQISNRAADQRNCFRYVDNKIPLLPKYEISSLEPSSLLVQPGLCGSWSKTSKTGFVVTLLN